MATYLKPKNEGTTFNLDDFKYQDKTLTVKDLNLKLDDFTNVDEALTTATNGNTAKLTDITYSSSITSVANLLKPTGSVDMTVATSGGGVPSCTLYGTNAGNIDVISGVSNSCYGVNAGLALTSGTHHTHVGFNAGQNAKTNIQNTAVGSYSLEKSNVNNQNSFGAFSGRFFNGASNNFFGSWCAQGVDGSSSGANNTAMGHQSLYVTESGSDNACLGYKTGVAMTSASRSVCVGSQAGKSITAGFGNIAVGYKSMSAGTGANNVAIGRDSICNGYNNVVIGRGANSGGGDNNIIIGEYAGTASSQVTMVAQDNQVIIGDNDVTNAYCKVAWDTTSDMRDKIDITVLNAGCWGLNYINELQPKMYRFNDRSRYIERVESIVDVVNEEGDTVQDVEITEVVHPNDGSKKDDKYKIGFLAQQVLECEEDNLCCDFSVINNIDPEHLKINETSLIPILVNAIKELTSRLEALESV